MPPRNLVLVGLSHHTAPLEVRERLAFSSEQLPRAAARPASSTRGAARSDDGLHLQPRGDVRQRRRSRSDSRARHSRVLRRARAGADLDTHLYEHTGEAVARHAFRVASSLDSLVVGEPQILGQVKDAFALASEAGTVGPLLGRCMNRAFAVAKRVRTETGIAAGAVSVSSIACDLARSIFGELTGRRVVLVGAGEMSEGAAKALAQHGTLLTRGQPQPRARARGGRRPAAAKPASSTSSRKSSWRPTW